MLWYLIKYSVYVHGVLLFSLYMIWEITSYKGTVCISNTVTAKHVVLSECSTQ